MKKRVLALLALGAACALLVTGCTKKNQPVSDPENPEAEEPGEVFPGAEEDVDVCYYGCPRSKRLRALKTRKRAV